MLKSLNISLNVGKNQKNLYQISEKIEFAKKWKRKIFELDERIK